MTTEVRFLSTGDTTSAVLSVNVRQYKSPHRILLWAQTTPVTHSATSKEKTRDFIQRDELVLFPTSTTGRFMVDSIRPRFIDTGNQCPICRCFKRFYCPRDMAMESVYRLIRLECCIVLLLIPRSKILDNIMGVKYIICRNLLDDGLDS